MTSASGNLAREVARGAIRVERARLTIPTALRTAALAAVVLVVSVALDQVLLGTSVVLGVAFIGLSDLGEDYPTRARTLTWSLLWCTVATLLGGLAAPHVPVHVALAVVVALLAGFAGALGTRGAFIGVITLVLFTIYSGQVVSGDIAAVDSLAFGIGGIISLVAALAAWPLRRLGATRSIIAGAYRAIAVGAGERIPGIVAPGIAAACLAATDAAEAAPAVGRSREWLVAVAATAQDIRLRLMAISGETRGTPDEAGAAAVASAVAQATRITARTLAWPVLAPHHRAALAPAVDRVRSAVAALADPGARDLGGMVVEALARVEDRLRGDWPIGARLERAMRIRIAPAPIGARLKAHLHRGDALAEHAVRLAIAIGIATALSTLDSMTHGYWLPMTVAWIVKPDLAGTVGRIAARILGTLVGATIAVAIAIAAPQSASLIALVTLATFLAAAFLWANYAIAVVGITALVLGLSDLAGESIEEDFALRIGLTLAAGALALLVVLVHPRRTGSALAAALAATCASLAAYSRALRRGEDPEPARRRVLRDRTTATVTVAAAVAEPPGLWDRHRPALDPQEGVRLLEDIVEAASALLAEEYLADALPADIAADRDRLWENAESAADDLAERLHRIDTGAPPPPRDVDAPTGTGAPDHPALRALDRARIRVAAAGIPPPLP